MNEVELNGKGHSLLPIRSLVLVIGRRVDCKSVNEEIVNFNGIPSALFVFCAQSYFVYIRKGQ